MILAKKKVPAGFSSVGSLTSLHFSFAMMRARSIENEMEMELRTVVCGEGNLHAETGGECVGAVDQFHFHLML